MNIKKIELQSSGFKGCTVAFLTHTMKNSRPFVNETIEKRKDPIHKDMEDLFKDLRIHLLDIFKINNIRLSEAERNSVILETQVTAIEFDNDSFILTGETEGAEEKFLKLKTYKVQQSDGYEGYDEVRKIIDDLKVEAVSYLDGLKVVSEREMMLRWLDARKDAKAKEEFENMTEEEQKAYISKKFKYDSGVEEMEEEEVEIESEGINLTDDVIELPDASVAKKGKKSKPEDVQF